MMNFMRKYKRQIIIAVIITFVIGIGLMAGDFVSGPSLGNNYIAKINGVKIKTNIFYPFYVAAVDGATRTSDTPLTDEQKRQIQHELLRMIIIEEVFSAEAKKYGIEVTDEELAKEIQRYSVFSNNGVFDARAYQYYVKNVLRITPEIFEERIRKQIAASKVQNLIGSSAKLWNTELQAVLKANRKATAQEIAGAKEGGVLNEWSMDLVGKANIRVNDKLLDDLL